MSRFQQLPPTVRNKILGYLLLSENVRQPPNYLLVEHYNFEVNVLRINRALNKEAAAILYGKNIFIKILSDFVDAATSMDNHEVPFFKLKEKFEHHAAEITVKFDPLNKRLPTSMKSRELTTFLFLLADVPKYTRVLRLLDLANFMGYQFDFKLHRPVLATSSLSTMEQVELLLPFEQVRGGALVQAVSFSGAFDPNVVKRVKEAMTQKVAWLRAGAWEIYEIALSIKRKGDWAMQLNNALTACAKYEDTTTFLSTALELNDMMKGLDQEVTKAYLGLNCMTQVDLAMLLISDATVANFGKRLYETVPTFTHHIEAAETAAAEHNPTVPVTVIARFYHLLGIAELGLNHPVKSAKAFVKAYQMVSTKAAEDGYDAAKIWKDLGKELRTVHLNDILAAMPRKPLKVPDMKEYFTPEVASEHWVMRELGYKGGILYEDKIKASVSTVLTNKPHRNHHTQGPRTAQIGLVQEAILQKHVDKYRKAMNQPHAQGRFICWVGLNHDQIGEETVLDEPGYVEAMRKHDFGRKRM